MRMDNRYMNTVNGFYFNTDNTITADCASPVLERVLDICAYYENLLSKTIPGSDIWRINHSCGEPVEISPHTTRIISLALEMREASGGKFDIAIGSVTSLWRFTDGSNIIPDSQALTGAVAAAKNAVVELTGDTVRTQGGTELDVGGIAKGYIADAIADELRKSGVESALINLGGNIVTVGLKPDGTPWKIGLQVPFTDRTYRDKFWSAVYCTDGSVVTSGSYERGFRNGGNWYHHIIDTATGMPAVSDVLSVTICAASGFLADALSTPLFLLGEHEGLTLADRYGVDAAYYLKDNRIVLNKGMNARISGCT